MCYFALIGGHSSPRRTFHETVPLLFEVRLAPFRKGIQLNVLFLPGRRLCVIVDHKKIGRLVVQGDKAPADWRISKTLRVDASRRIASQRLGLRWQSGSGDTAFERAGRMVTFHPGRAGESGVARRRWPSA